MENKQKLIIGAIIAGVLIVGIGIGNAGNGNSSADNSTSSTQVDPAPAPVYTAEDYFLTEVRSTGNSYVDNNSDADLLKVGHQTCDVLDQGYTVTDVATYLVQNSDSSDSSFFEFEGIVIGAAVRNLCPEYESQIP